MSELAKHSSQKKLNCQIEVELVKIDIDDKIENDNSVQMTLDTCNKLEEKIINDVETLEEVDPTYNPDGIETWQAFFLNFKSLVGVGILAFPHIVQEVGYQACLVTYLFIYIALCFGLYLIMEVADNLGYYDNS